MTKVTEEEILSETIRLCLFGSPVQQSRSPWIHQQFAQQFDLSVEYDAREVSKENFASAVRAFQASGGLGCNITVPCKALAFALADQVSERAAQAGAVNTFLFREDGSIFADNTDGIGLLSDIKQRLNFSLANKRVLLLGAGGAARGVLGPLLAEQPEQLVVANRTFARAQELAAHFSSLGSVSALPFSDLVEQDFDVIIDSSSAEGLVDLLPEGLTLNPAGLCYDLKYRPHETALMRWAQAQGVTKISDGFGMLLAQAAHSFSLWTGHQPDYQRLFL